MKLIDKIKKAIMDEEDDELEEEQLVKKIDVEEVKKEFDMKVNEIRMELVDLDKEKALDIAKEKAADLKEKAQELYDLALEKGTPVLKKTAKDVLENVIKVSKDTIKKLDKKEEKAN